MKIDSGKSRLLLVNFDRLVKINEFKVFRAKGEVGEIFNTYGSIKKRYDLDYYLVYELVIYCRKVYERRMFHGS